MRTRLAPKAALAALAAVGLFLPFGAPLPGPCLHAIGVAGAAPSPSCSGDLRECLRASADLHQTTFGGRYVPADDVARCMDAFNACTSGGAVRSIPNPPTRTSATNGGTTALPQHFGMTGNNANYDCTVSGNAVNCSVSLKELPAGTDSSTGKLSGTLAGRTVTGTLTIEQTAHGLAEPDCISHQISTASITYTFNPEGSVAMSTGPFQTRGTITRATVNDRGICSGSNEFTTPGGESTGSWSAIG